MEYFRHSVRGSGFGVRAEPDDQLPVIEAGEVWAPRNWRIRPHANQGWEAYLQAKGRSRWLIGQEEAVVPEGGAYLIKGGVEHRLLELMDESTHFFYAVFPEEAVPQAVRAAACWRGNYTTFPSAEGLRVPFQGIIEELAMREAWQAEMCRSYVAALATALARLSERRWASRGWAGHPLAERAMRLLANRIDYPWRLQELARLCGLSVPHLIEVFRSEFGQTPMKRLHSLRLEEARRQLQQTDKTVTQVAFDVGFSSSQHLSRAFREAYGCTPSEGRRGRNRRSAIRSADARGGAGR